MSIASESARHYYKRTRKKESVDRRKNEEKQKNKAFFLASLHGKVTSPHVQRNLSQYAEADTNYEDKQQELI